MRTRCSGTHRYTVTDRGLRTAIFLSRVHTRLVRPGLADLLTDHDPHTPLRRHLDRFDAAINDLARTHKLIATVEESFQAGKGLAGLDEHQVRRWTSWRRWTLLAMVAHALLAVIAANEHPDQPVPAGLIPLTCNEIRRLFTIFIIEPGRPIACPLTWSKWRRRQQHRARTSHYQRQEAARAWT